jgi:hypothetical protein
VWVCVVLTVCWQDNGQGEDDDANTMGRLDHFEISASRSCPLSGSRCFPERHKAAIGRFSSETKLVPAEAFVS